jgi:hypothetical protein
VRRKNWELMKQRIAALPTAPPPPPPPWKDPRPSTQRANLAIKRKRRGIRCIYVTVHEEVLDGLVHACLLPADLRHSRQHIRNALEGFLHDALVQRVEHQLWAKTARHNRAQDWQRKHAGRDPNGRFLPKQICNSSPQPP